MKEQKIQMVFFDAAGTLFDVRGSVGEIYARFALRYGKQVDAADLQSEFARQFRRQPPMTCASGLSPVERLRQEQDWWRRLVREVFARFGEFPQLEGYFVEIFEFFRTADAWQVFADVEPTLAALKQRGLRLGVISNFDARCYDVLRALNLLAYFDSIHLSTEAGAAKPDSAIFLTALQANDLHPAQVLHIGDQWEADVMGARAAGVSALWLTRNLALKPERALSQITSLHPNVIPLYGGAFS